MQMIYNEVRFIRFFFFCKVKQPNLDLRFIYRRYLALIKLNTLAETSMAVREIWTFSSTCRNDSWSSPPASTNSRRK